MSHGPRVGCLAYMTVRALGFSVALLCGFASPAFAEAGFPLEFCRSATCACGATTCTCGQVCNPGSAQCLGAEAAFCTGDAQCQGSCGVFHCELNVCRPGPPQVRDAGLDFPPADAGHASGDGGTDSSTHSTGCAVAVGFAPALAVLVFLFRGLRR